MNFARGLARPENIAVPRNDSWLLRPQADRPSLPRSRWLSVLRHPPSHAPSHLDCPALRRPISLRLVPLPERLQLIEAAQVGVLGHVGDLAQPRQVIGLGGGIRRRRSSRWRSGVLGIAPLGGEAVLFLRNVVQRRLQIAGAEPAPTIERERDILGGDREHGPRRLGLGDHRLQNIEHGRRGGAVLT